MSGYFFLLQTIFPQLSRVNRAVEWNAEDEKLQFFSHFEMYVIFVWEELSAVILIGCMWMRFSFNCRAKNSFFLPCPSAFARTRVRVISGFETNARYAAWYRTYDMMMVMEKNYRVKNKCWFFCNFNWNLINFVALIFS